MSSFTDPAQHGKAVSPLVLRPVLGLLTMLTACCPVYDQDNTCMLGAEDSSKERLARLVSLFSRRYSVAGGNAKEHPKASRDSSGSNSTQSLKESNRPNANTPKGRYIRQVTSQIEKKWHIYRLLRRDEGLMRGMLELEFYVNKKGKVEDLRVINDKESYPLLKSFTLQAIRDADIPPIPADVLPSLPIKHQERLKIEYNVLIY